MVVELIGLLFIGLLSLLGYGNLVLAVDQHAAHERIRLEMLENQYINFANSQTLTAILPTPLRIEVNSAEVGDKELLAKLTRFGM